MKLTFLIIFFISTTVYGQTFDNFKNYLAQHFSTIKESVGQIDYLHFSQLIDKRDTIYLKRQLNNNDASLVYLIEGYDFKSGKYSLYEEYYFSPITEMFGTCRSFLNGKDLETSNCYSGFDSTFLDENQIEIDTIFPRKYRYGIGCDLTRKTSKIANRLREKAKADGIVIENYCRIETIISKADNKVFCKFLFPVAGKRETNISWGMGNTWPPGLDFWLFVTPKFTGK